MLLSIMSRQVQETYERIVPDELIEGRKNRLPAALGVNRDRAEGGVTTKQYTSAASWIQTMANS